MPTAAPDTDVRPDTTLSPDVVLDTDDGGHDRFSHYARKADILRAQVEGIPCIALCGKAWVPSHDPEKYPVCPDCKRIYDELND